MQPTPTVAGARSSFGNLGTGRVLHERSLSAKCPLLEPGHDLAQIGAYLLKCSTFAAAFGEAEEADARGGQCAS